KNNRLLPRRAPLRLPSMIFWGVENLRKSHRLLPNRALLRLPAMISWQVHRSRLRRPPLRPAVLLLGENLGGSARWAVARRFQNLVAGRLSRNRKPKRRPTRLGWQLDGFVRRMVLHYLIDPPGTTIHFLP